MSQNLLQIIRTGPLRSEGRYALLHEFVVDPRLAPYLVSGWKKDLLWVERPRQGGSMQGSVLRAAIREGLDVGALFRKVVWAVVDRGNKYDYGNTCPLTQEGIREAISYVLYFLEGPETQIVNPLATRMELLVAEGTEWDKAETFVTDLAVLPVRVAPWLPPGVAVVVPLDRGYLGDVHIFGNDQYAVVIHNPTRGMAVAYNPEERQDAEVASGDVESVSSDE